MKKLFAVIALFFAFTIGASAQETNIDNARIVAKNDAIELGKYLGLEDQIVKDLYGLFYQKYTVLMGENVSVEQKAEILKSVEFKLRATFSQEQYEKFEKNKDLMKKILN